MSIGWPKRVKDTIRRCGICGSKRRRMVSRRSAGIDPWSGRPTHTLEIKCRKVGCGRVREVAA